MHQMWTVRQSKFFDQEVVLNGFQLGFITSGDQGRIPVVDGRSQPNSDLFKKLKIWCF